MHRHLGHPPYTNLGYISNNQGAVVWTDANGWVTPYNYKLADDNTWHAVPDGTYVDGGAFLNTYDKRATDLSQALYDNGAQNLTNVCTPASWYVATNPLTLPGAGAVYAGADYVELLDSLRDIVKAACSKYGW